MKPTLKVLAVALAAVSLVQEGRVTDERSVREGLEGNLCRCTGYHNIVKAIAAGAKAMKGHVQQQA